MLPSYIDRILIPHKPGVYQYKNKAGKVIYVGKAIDLYHRVASYFSKSYHDPKTSALVSEIASVETIIVESELEALILEANLIKKYLPQFNIRLTDDKDYLYIKITKEDFPKILTARKQDLGGSLRYFGPFPSSRVVQATLKNLRRVFPWCSGKGYRASFLDTATRSGSIAKTRFRPCFYYHLGQCPGACIGEISKENYRKIINRFSKFMEGKVSQLVDELIMEMNQSSENQNFEEAAKIKRTLGGIGYLTQANRVHVYLENPNFLEDQRTKALEQLQESLGLSKIPERIEGYDISNIQGQEAVASMVVLTDGEIDKSQYRKFKMFISGKPNDYAMHQETIRRRMKHPEWKTPDMLLVDGGKGQVSAVYEQVQKTGPEEFKNIPIFGIAKRMEWLYTPDGREIKLPKSNRGLQLLQRLRDESHRFAITYHRKLHRKATLGNMI